MTDPVGTNKESGKPVWDKKVIRANGDVAEDTVSRSGYVTPQNRAASRYDIQRRRSTNLHPESALQLKVNNEYIYTPHDVAGAIFHERGVDWHTAYDLANQAARNVDRPEVEGLPIGPGTGGGRRTARAGRGAGNGQGAGAGQGGGGGAGDEASDEVVAPAVPGAGGGARKPGGFGAGAAGGTGKGIGAAGAAAAGLEKPSFGSSYIESAKSLLRAVLTLMITGAGNNNPFVNIAKMLAGKSMVEVAKTLTEAGMTDEVVNGNPMLRHEALLVDTQAAGLRGIFETAIQYWNQAAQANKQIEKDTHQLAQRA